MSSNIKEKYESCKKECEELRKKIDALRGDEDENHLQVVSAEKSIGETALTLKARKVLKGHFGKIYAMHWSSDSKNLVSASQDGKLIVWNGYHQQVAGHSAAVLVGDDVLVCSIGIIRGVRRTGQSVLDL